MIGKQAFICLVLLESSLDQCCSYHVEEVEWNRGNPALSLAADRGAIITPKIYEDEVLSSDHEKDEVGSLAECSFVASSEDEDRELTIADILEADRMRQPGENMETIREKVLAEAKK